MSNFDQDVIDYALEDACMKVANVKSVQKCSPGRRFKCPQEHTACTELLCRSCEVTSNKWRTRMEPRRPPVCKILLPRWYMVPCTEIAMRLGGSQNKCALRDWSISGSFKLAAGACFLLPHRFFCVAMLCLKDTKASLRVCFSYLSLSLFKPVWCFISLTVRYTL